MTMMSAKHLLRAVCKALSDTQRIVDDEELKDRNERFNQALSIENPHVRLFSLKYLHDELDPPRGFW